MPSDGADKTPPADPFWLVGKAEAFIAREPPPASLLQARGMLCRN